MRKSYCNTVYISLFPNYKYHPVSKYVPLCKKDNKQNQWMDSISIGSKSRRHHTFLAAIVVSEFWFWYRDSIHFTELKLWWDTWDAPDILPLLDRKRLKLFSDRETITRIEACGLTWQPPHTRLVSQGWPGASSDIGGPHLGQAGQAG